MSNIVEFPTQTSWRKQGEIPKATEHVFLVAERLLGTINRERDELTSEEKTNLAALKAVFSELSLTNFDLVSKMNEAEKKGLINHVEKVIATSVFLTIQKIRSDIAIVQKESIGTDFFSTETEEKIFNSNLNQNIKSFLTKIIRKIKE